MAVGDNVSHKRLASSYTAAFPLTKLYRLRHKSRSSAGCACKGYPPYHTCRRAAMTRITGAARGA
jgi:hypothetical protein